MGSLLMHDKLTLTDSPARSIHTPGFYRAFHRFAVSFWPAPDHRERVEVEVIASADSREAALSIGADMLGRFVGDCIIGWPVTVTRRIDE
jgi:hypothetical protein